MNFDRLFRPRSIAVFGGREAAEVVRQCDRMGYAGDVWPVHPHHDAVLGRRCFRSAADLPGAPDAVFLGVNRRLTVEIVGELARKGAGGVICYASGFREAEDGAALQDALLAAAGEMPVVGPNCYGFINYLDGALLWPDQHGGERVERGVAIVTQSSNIVINMTMQRRSLPIAYVTTAGNQAQIGLAEIAEGLIEDSRVTALGLHIEGVSDVPRFERMALRARELGKPIVALVVGRSAESKAATISHTASIAGSEAASDAFFARLGVPRLRSIPEFLEALKLLHVHGPLPGGDLCSMSCSGGEASVMADAAIGRKVRYRALDPDERLRVKATLSDLVTIANPLDYHTFIWGKEQAMVDTFSAMIGCGFDLSMLVLDFPRLDRCTDESWDATVRAISTAVEATGARTAVVASLPENMPEARGAELLAAGIAPMCGMEEAIAAAEAAAFIGARWREPLAKPALVRGSSASEPRVWYEAEAKEALSAAGVPVPRREVVSTPEGAIRAAEAIGFPVAVKSVGVAHKSEAGAVRLNLATAGEVELAAHDLQGIGTALLVEAMITDSIAELLVGVTRDPQFGLLLTIGAGGVLVELIGDRSSLLLPADAEEVHRAILSLKTAPLLQGFRGRPVADLQAAADAAMAIARYAEAHADLVEEVEVNPLLVRPEGKGAIAADALIQMREANKETLQPISANSA